MRGEYEHREGLPSVLVNENLDSYCLKGPTFLHFMSPKMLLGRKSRVRSSTVPVSEFVVVSVGIKKPNPALCLDVIDEHKSALLGHSFSGGCGGEWEDTDRRLLCGLGVKQGLSALLHRRTFRTMGVTRRTRVSAIYIDYDRATGTRYEGWRKVVQESMMVTYPDMPLSGRPAFLWWWSLTTKFGGKTQLWLRAFLR